MTIGWESGRSGCSLANWYDECYRTTPIAGSKRKLKKWTRAGPINERTYARLNGLTKRDLEPWMIKKMIKKKQLIDKHLYVSILKLKQNIFNCLDLDFKASNRNRDRKKNHHQLKRCKAVFARLRQKPFGKYKSPISNKEWTNAFKFTFIWNVVDVNPMPCSFHDG